VRPEDISRPDKPLFPDGTTKLDLARYYDRVAGVMVPHVAGRPLNLERYPDGIEGRQLFTQQAPGHFPGWIRRATVPKRGGTVDHVLVERRETLVYLAGQACITLHAWTSRRDRLDRPDRLILDLDPSVDDFASVRAAAREAGDLFRECGLVPFAMVTGSRGIHVVAPLRRTTEHADVAKVGRGIAAVLAERDPDRLTTEFRIDKRGDRIYLDVGRVRWGHTAVAPYSVRARPGAPVATPLAWSELDDEALDPRGWTLHTLPGRLERLGGDPWADIAGSARGLSRARRTLRIDP
jgi:bifunctional non-homologous end joining protein LigD